MKHFPFLCVYVNVCVQNPFTKFYFGDVTPMREQIWNKNVNQEKKDDQLLNETTEYY